MPLSSQTRRELLAASHGLKPVVTVTPESLSDAVMEQVRTAFARRELLKVRVGTDARAACAAAADELARRVPCELVGRVGRVLILYRPAPATKPPRTMAR